MTASVASSKDLNRDIRLGWTHVLIAEGSAGKPLVYTGRAGGSNWVSSSFADRFAMGREYAIRTAERFNKNTGIHGLTFRPENVKSAAALFSRKKNPRIRDTSNTVRSGTVAYKGYLIQPMMAGGFVITQGKHHISFASSVAAAKKIIDDAGISARNPRKRSAGKTVARNPAQKVFAISSRVDTLKPWKVYAVAPTFEAAKQIAKSLQDRGYYSRVTN